MKILNRHSCIFQLSTVMKPLLGFLWCLLHLLVSLVHTCSYLVQQFQFIIISLGFLKKYKNLRLDRLHHLAIVIDSDEAKNKRRIEKLLRYLSDIGVKSVTLYDIEGVLKKSNELDLNISGNPYTTKLLDRNLNLNLNRKMKVELLCQSDGKEGIAKAASFLCSNYLRDQNQKTLELNEPRFTEADMSNALNAVGHGGPEPDLLLVYGPARCHLGFPAWRLRYTEIVHMGLLKSMKYGAIVKTIYDFSKKHQNYGK